MLQIVSEILFNHLFFIKLKGERIQPRSDLFTTFEGAVHKHPRAR